MRHQKRQTLFNNRALQCFLWLVLQGRFSKPKIGYGTCWYLPTTFQIIVSDLYLRDVPFICCGNPIFQLVNNLWHSHLSFNKRSFSVYPQIVQWTILRPRSEAPDGDFIPFTYRWTSWDIQKKQSGQEWIITFPITRRTGKNMFSQGTVSIEQFSIGQKEHTGLCRSNREAITVSDVGFTNKSLFEHLSQCFTVRFLTVLYCTLRSLERKLRKVPYYGTKLLLASFWKRRLVNMEDRSRIICVRGYAVTSNHRLWSWKCTATLWNGFNVVYYSHIKLPIYEAIRKQYSDSTWRWHWKYSRTGGSAHPSISKRDSTSMEMIQWW